VRVYIPATLTMLQTLVADGAIHRPPRDAFAVPPRCGIRTSRVTTTSSQRWLCREGCVGVAALLRRRDIRRLPATSVVLDCGVDARTLRPDPRTTPWWRFTGPVGNRRVIAALPRQRGGRAAVLQAIEVIDSSDRGSRTRVPPGGHAQDHDLAGMPAKS